MMMLPLYEAKMIHHYDVRWATYEPDGTTRYVTPAEKSGDFEPMPRYWVAESDIDKKLAGRWGKAWFLGWRDICRATDARTVIATRVPRVGYGDPCLLALPTGDANPLQVVWSSFALDFVARQKLGGTHMKFFTFMQLPMPTPAQLAAVPIRFPGGPADWLGERVDRLNARPNGRNDEERAWWRAELDALAAHLFGLHRDEVDYVLDTFPIVARQDVAQFGEFRTKRLILAAFDAMSTARDTGTVYDSEPARSGAR